MEKMHEEPLGRATGGEGTEGYVWFVAQGVVTGIDSHISIRYTPGGEINYGAGGWAKGEKVFGDPNNVVWSHGIPWRRCVRNGFFDWVNDNYLAR